MPAKPDPVETLRLEVEKLRRQVEAQSTTIRQHLGANMNSSQPSWPHGVPLFPVREIHGPYRGSTATGKPLEMIVDFDDFVAKLHSAKLSFKIRPVRSNVSAATGLAGGGGVTTANSGGGTTIATPAGGGKTAVANGAHNHTVGSHSHSFEIASHSHTVSGGSAIATGNTIGVVSAVTTQAASPTATQAESASHYHDGTGAGSPNVGSHTHSLNAHTHPVSATITNVPHVAHVHSIVGSAADAGGGVSSSTLAGGGTTSSDGGSHTHTVPDHTHDITVPSHEHSVTLNAHSHTVNLTYGIYEGPTPVDPDVSLAINGVDVTTLLGGPWNADQSGIDITRYLREASGEPLAGQNILSFSADELVDLEVVVKSVVIPADLLSAGV